jgi:cephalosporin hydroxylase
MGWPPAVDAPLDVSVRDYWRQRLSQHTQDSYRGRTLAKFPEDLRTYQHLLEVSRPEVVVELGTYDGGSAVWFADQLQVMLGPGREVITVDLARRRPLRDRRIRSLVGDLADPLIADRVTRFVDGRRALVIDDSAHTYSTTLAALKGYSHLVQIGCWFVVEDGVVDEPDLTLWPGVMGVQAAITDFMASEQGERFTRHALAPYGLTTCQTGWLEARGHL